MKELLNRANKTLNDCSGKDILGVYSLLIFTISVSFLSVLKDAINGELRWYIIVLFGILIALVSVIEVVLYKNLKSRIIDRP